MHRAASGDMMEAVGGCFSESPVIAFFLIWQRMRHWECVKKPHCCFLKWRLMTRWKTASEWSSTWGTLHIWRAALSTAEETQLKLWAALDTNFPLSSPLPGWSTRWRTLSFPPPPPSLFYWFSISGEASCLRSGRALQTALRPICRSQPAGQATALCQPSCVLYSQG